ncbi:glycoside hydrolase family 71/99-like protein [Flammeovirga agarivorans]|uniref:Xylosidase n=1 Tax=Flammeovirga agarivorans TaxID=2726742 RepID=A0A7X8SNJ7_9BACT|nr:glycoside hydrolase family 71/99-like protein [Flammeovirga agarivorans]NLR93516.1 xylosidase [Flammeovirga agarivorans]
MKLYKLSSILIISITCLTLLFSFNKEKKEKLNYPSYKGLVMCGYQGWFRAPGDGGHQGWGHFGRGNKFGPDQITIDMWPDVREYKKQYSTKFKNEDGSKAKVFSSLDASTVDLHFKWMKEYGIDGVFMQRFYQNTNHKEKRKEITQILSNAFDAANKYDRAIAVMYDLSGLKKEESCYETLVADWKSLIGEFHFNKGKNKKNYLHHNGKPLVSIWGVGFVDRKYSIQSSEIERFINFLKNDPKYGGFSVMLGVPTKFRSLEGDCLPDPALHDVIKKVDIVQPWFVGRFKMKHLQNDVYKEQVSEDIAWCKQMGVDYVPTIYPGFSWYNLQNVKGDRGYGINASLNAIPRSKGEFLNKQIDITINKGSEMLYVAMFDEIDEGTAIMKVTNQPPVNGVFADYEGLPSDHYLKIIGQASRKIKQATSIR